MIRFKRRDFNLFHSKTLLTLLLLFLLVFPKGGFKLAGIPLTWGYALLGLFSFFALLRRANPIQKERFYSFLATLPFFLIAAASLFCNGIKPGASGMTLSFVISFFFLPLAFFLLFSHDLETLDTVFFISFFRKAILFLALYGIALFCFKQATGRFLEIPLLTVNLGDLGELENKSINRGLVCKLISTYNNGNIFGVCLLILFPLFCFVEPSRARRLLVKFALLLTLSRTVWIGLCLHEILYQWFFGKDRRSLVFTLLGIVATVFIGMSLLSHFFHFSWGFLTDLSFGGRSWQMEAIANTGWISDEPFIGFFEIVYAAVIYSFGWLGLFAFLLAVAGPLLYALFFRRCTPIQKAIALGLVNYLILSASDGATLLLPTMAFYWFMLSFLFRKDAQPVAAPSGIRPSY